MIAWTDFVTSQSRRSVWASFHFKRCCKLPQHDMFHVGDFDLQTASYDTGVAWFHIEKYLTVQSFSQEGVLGRSRHGRQDNAAHYIILDRKWPIPLGVLVRFRRGDTGRAAVDSAT
ncbi:hypothetical protein EVAR_90325_1 [Eumeta japonica]|uniref:Uncharacterized protein n=1 Tax=Eumeta variegata TaxID=151549 RepID=A0A4C1YG70_EUMVA|nr:hypothetical protein EVAR_90325_1 [Eumeta japonica]